VKHTVQIIFKFYYYSLNEDTYLKNLEKKICSFLKLVVGNNHKINIASVEEGTAPYTDEQCRDCPPPPPHFEQSEPDIMMASD
jgi:hypothetical protein